MKVAFLYFNHFDTARVYRDALRARMYTVGYEPHQVTEIFHNWFPAKKLTAYITGTAHAALAADVARVAHGVLCKLRNEP
jgi:hypothetical protein